MMGVIARFFLGKDESTPVVHDPRLAFNIRDVASKYGGVPVQSKTGHLFMKQRCARWVLCMVGRFQHTSLF